MGGGQEKPATLYVKNFRLPLIFAPFLPLYFVKNAPLLAP